MKKERRWLKSVIETSRQPIPALPWQRASDLKAPPVRRRELPLAQGATAVR